jgi:hypothetical protein
LNSVEPMGCNTNHCTVGYCYFDFIGGHLEDGETVSL